MMGDMTTTDLTTQTPAEVDTALGAIYDRWYDLSNQIQRLALDAKRMEQGLASGRSYYSQDSLDRTLARISDLQDAAAATMRSTAPYNEEYDRRGGWTRAWLVDNAGGHVHRSMGCSTCYPTTQFNWLPQASGLDEAEIVAQAGEGACTICYPDAPVATRSAPRLLDRLDRIAAREVRAAEKAAREAKKAAKAIGPLSVYDWTNPTTGNERRETITTLHAARGWLTDSQETWGRAKRQEDIDLVAEAVAAKEGKTVAEVLAEAAKRASKRS